MKINNEIGNTQTQSQAEYWRKFTVMLGEVLGEKKSLKILSSGDEETPIGNKYIYHVRWNLLNKTPSHIKDQALAWREVDKALTSKFPYMYDNIDGSQLDKTLDIINRLEEEPRDIVKENQPQFNELGYTLEKDINGYKIFSVYDGNSQIYRAQDDNALDELYQILLELSNFG